MVEHLFEIASMTAFAPSQLPATVDSVEKLAAWATSILAELYPSLSITVSAGNAERIAQQNTFFFTANSPPIERLVNVLYLPVLGTWRSDKAWKSAQSPGTSTIPAAYTT